MGGFVFGNIHKISGLLEGWVLTFLIQEVPLLLFEFSAYMIPEVEGIITFGIEF